MAEPHGAICFSGARGGGEGWPSLPACTHSIPPVSPPSKSFILCPLDHLPLSLPKKNPPDNFKEWRVPQHLDLWTPVVVMATAANFVFEDGNGGAGLGVWEGIVVVRCVCGERGGAEKERTGIVVLVFRVSANQSNCWVFIKGKR